YSASGQLISSGIILNNKIDVSRLINGLYVIDIDDVKGTAQKKFIKE
ncbi:T9SS type A sorting domain-containing protein, partial [Chryseobacterium binzhouense]